MHTSGSFRFADQPLRDVQRALSLLLALSFVAREGVDREPAPFASRTDPQPLYTGRLEGKAHQTSGRATIYRTSDGRQYLRLTDFKTSNGPDVHVVLGQTDDANLTKEIVTDQLDSVELGQLKGNQGDQNYDLPSSVDLQKYNAAVI